jgi:hypothetical protein
MNKALILGAVAGLASGAAAQSWSLSIEGAPSTVDTTVTTVFTVDIVANADFGTHVAGGSFALDSTGATDAVVNVGASAAAWAAVGEANRGYAGGGDHNGLVYGQVIFPPFLQPSPDSALAGGSIVASLSIEVLAGSTGVLDLNLISDALAPFDIEIYDANSGTFTNTAQGSFGSASVNLIPSPSALVLLGLGGLVAGRRRN